MRTWFGALVACWGLTTAGLGLAVADNPAGETCKAGAAQETAPSQNGPWHAPSKETDSTPLNCSGVCPDVSGSSGTCLERKLTTGLAGTPPTGGGEYACCCVYTFFINGELVTQIVVDPACDKRIHKTSSGDPAPWNQEGGADDFKCTGTCPANTCKVDPVSGPTEESPGVWKRSATCECLP